MSVSDLRITEVMYNPASGAPPFIEVTNTGTLAVSAGDFIVGNSDFLPEYYQVIGPNATLAPTIPAGATIVLVPSVPDTSGEVFVPPVPISQAEFEAAYGPLPAGTVYFNYPAYFVSEGPNPYNGNATYTIGAIDVFADSVFIPGDALAGQSVSVSLTDGSTSFGAPSPGSTDGVSPPPPPPEANEINGGDSSDVLNGTSGDDIIDGGSGNDEITAGAGNDEVFGGKGGDIINAGAGDDYVEGGGQHDTINGASGHDDIFGGSGNDSIKGGNGEDELFGGSGNDRIAGGADDDIIFGDHGKDMLAGGGGNDALFGGVSNDTLDGNDGDDELDGGKGNDVLRGGDGADILDGGSQSDTMNGGTGDDILFGGLGNDRMIGGEGADTFVFAGTTNDDVITDFEVGVDKIDFTAYGPISDAEAVAIASQVANNVVLDLGPNGEVTLRNIDLADLSLDDFIYIPDDIFVVG